MDYKRQYRRRKLLDIARLSHIFGIATFGVATSTRFLHRPINFESHLPTVLDNSLQKARLRLAFSSDQMTVGWDKGFTLM